MLHVQDINPEIWLTYTELKLAVKGFAFHQAPLTDEEKQRQGGEMTELLSKTAKQTTFTNCLQNQFNMLNRAIAAN